jgi:hypothetical protein
MPSVRGVLALAGTLSAIALPTPVARAGESCAPTSYSYAGLASMESAFGVAATLQATAPPWVSGGHVAAWVGVGGSGFGPHGSDEWIQAGLDAFPGTLDSIYYEVARPGLPVEYGAIQTGALVRTRHRIAVFELRRRPDWWEVWVDGRPAAGPFFLPGSGGNWAPQATAESWGAGTACNRFAYRFDDISLATRTGGGWRTLRRAAAFADPGYRVIRRSRASFIAIARAFAS